MILAFVLSMFYLSTSYTQVVGQVSSQYSEEGQIPVTNQIALDFPEPDEQYMNKIRSQAVQDNVLVIATANYGMRDYVYNWIASLEKTSHEKYLVFCIDDDLYTHMEASGYGDHASKIPAEWFHKPIEASFSDYYSPTYAAITHAKTLVVQRLLYLGFTVFFSDVDIVWLKPHIVDFLAGRLSVRQETEVLFQQEGYDQMNINSGFYIMRPTDKMKQLLLDTIVLQDSGEYTQQGAMNRALNNLDMDMRTSSVVLLDLFMFPNGFAYFQNDVPQRWGIEPYIAHANYLVADQKRDALANHGMWYVDQTKLEKADAVVESKHPKQTNEQ
ncbi:hypothetical protein VKS41_007493 [Umbelopsis sp. WA50703]